jgi:hypothetical protein
MALHFLYYNFVRIRQTLRTTPAMAAEVTYCAMQWRIGLIDDEPPANGQGKSLMLLG